MSTALAVIHDPVSAPMAQRNGQALAEAGPIGRRTSLDFDAMLRMGEALITTGFLPKAIRTPAQAAAVILAGHELGLPPMYALRVVHIVDGKPTLAAELQLGMFRKAGGRYQWRRSDEHAAELWLRHPCGDEHTETFTIEEARTAGLTNKDNWKKYPKSMLRARTASMGLRAIAPDLIGNLYDPDELGAIYDGTGTGDVILPADLPRATDAGTSAASDEPEARCPKCKGAMWDNREGKTNPKAPDFKCRERSCDGVYWPGQWPPAPVAAEEQLAAIRAHVGQPWLSKQQSNGIEKRLGRGMSAKEAHEALEFCLAKQKEHAAQQQEQGGFDLANEEQAEAADLDAHLNGEATTASDPRTAAMERIRALLQHPACAAMAPTMTTQLADPTVTMPQLEMSEALLKETIEAHVRKETAKAKGGKKQAPQPHSLGAALPGEESENWFPDAEKKPDTRVRD